MEFQEDNFSDLEVYRTYLPATLLRLIRICLLYCNNTRWRVTSAHLHFGSMCRMEQSCNWRKEVRQHTVWVVIILILFSFLFQWPTTNLVPFQH